MATEAYVRFSRFWWWLDRIVNFHFTTVRDKNWFAWFTRWWITNRLTLTFIYDNITRNRFCAKFRDRNAFDLTVWNTVN